VRNRKNKFQLSFEFSYPTPAPIPVKTKFCGLCKKDLPLDEFKGTLYGGLIYRTYCKQCLVGVQKNWVENNRERHNASIRKRYAADPDTTIIRVMNARTKKAGVTGSITPAQWKELKTLYSNRCAYCGLETLKLHIDHIWPLALIRRNLEISKFATNTIDNIVPACVWCNEAKQDRPFIIMLGWKNGLLS
jgi:5-methylcytosine-specific restriction endonuclease McrA